MADKWNYRIVEEDDQLMMARVDYDKSGKPYQFEPVQTDDLTVALDYDEKRPHDLALDEMTQTLRRMAKALDLPVLVAPDDFTGEEPVPAYDDRVGA